MTDKTLEDGLIKERRAEVRSIMNDHCLTCKKLELVIDRLDKTDKKKNWLTITGIGLICTLIINLSVMTGIWRELDRLSRTVDTNTKIIYETKGVVEYLKSQNK